MGLHLSIQKEVCDIYFIEVYSKYETCTVKKVFFYKSEN